MSLEGPSSLQEVAVMSAARRALLRGPFCPERFVFIGQRLPSLKVPTQSFDLLWSPFCLGSLIEIFVLVIEPSRGLMSIRTCVSLSSNPIMNTYCEKDNFAQILWSLSFDTRKALAPKDVRPEFG